MGFWGVGFGVWSFGIQAFLGSSSNPNPHRRLRGIICSVGPTSGWCLVWLHTSSMITFPNNNPVSKKLVVNMVDNRFRVHWGAVKEPKLSYFIGETLFFIIYIPTMVT